MGSTIPLSLSLLPRPLVALHTITQIYLLCVNVTHTESHLSFVFLYMLTYIFSNSLYVSLFLDL
jgi:hypothetical protein